MPAVQLIPNPVRVMRRRSRRASRRALDLGTIEKVLTHAAVLSLTLLVFFQFLLIHPLGQHWFPFPDAPEGQAWPAVAGVTSRQGWLALTGAPHPELKVLVDGTVVGTLVTGSLTLPVRHGQRLSLAARSLEQPWTVRVAASHQVEFPSRGAWIRLVPGGGQVDWGHCRLYP